MLFYIFKTFCWKHYSELYDHLNFYYSDFSQRFCPHWFKYELTLNMRLAAACFGFEFEFEQYTCSPTCRRQLIYRRAHKKLYNCSTESLIQEHSLLLTCCCWCCCRQKRRGWDLPRGCDASALQTRQEEEDSTVQGGSHGWTRKWNANTGSSDSQWPGKKTQICKGKSEIVKRWSDNFEYYFWQVASLQHHTGDPYDLSNEEEDHGPKDSTKTYRYSVKTPPAVQPHFSSL